MTRAEYEEIENNIKSIRAGRTRRVAEHRQHVSFSMGAKFSRSYVTRPKNKFSKQVVVKMISNLPTDRISACLNYTLENSLDGFAINEKGERVKTDKVLREWGNDFGLNKNSKDAWHLMFSIKEPCDNERTLKKLEASVRDVLGNNFAGHKYAFVLHTHQNNPHIHLILNKRNDFTKKKIHFNSRDEIKDFFDDVRTNFAYALGTRGLKYENKHFYQKDIKAEFNKIKKNIKLEADDYIAKDAVADYYLKIQNKNKEKERTTASRIDAMNAELEILKKENFELERLFWELRKNKNKRYFKVGKQLGEHNKILKAKRYAVLNENKKLDKIINQGFKINEMHLVHYKDQSAGLALLENFTYNFKKIYPKNSPLKPNKADFEMYHKARRAIAVHRNRESDLARKYFEDSLVLTRMFGSEQNIFKLSKALDVLDKSLHIYEHSALNNGEMTDFLKTLKSNKEFMTNVANKRFERVSQRLLKAEKINANDFLYKEYIKCTQVLGVKADEQILIKVKEEQKLYKDVLAKRGIKIAKLYSKSHSSAHDKSQNSSNERGGRERVFIKK